MPSHVPCESSRSDSRRLHAGHRPASQRPSAGLLPRALLIRLGFDVTYPVTTRQQRSQTSGLRTVFLIPTWRNRVRLFPSRSPRRSSANAAPGGLEPPAVGRFRRAYLHLSHSIASRSLDYMIRPLSTFVAHQGSGHSARQVGNGDRLTWGFAATGTMLLAWGAP